MVLRKISCGPVEIAVYLANSFSLLQQLNCLARSARLSQICDIELHSCSLLYILDTNLLFFFVFQEIQASLPIDLGQERSQDPSKRKKKKGKIKGPSTELEQVAVTHVGARKSISTRRNDTMKYLE